MNDTKKQAIETLSERTRRGEISRRQRLKDNDQEHVAPKDMISELRSDNQQLTKYLRFTHDLCDQHKDVATASLIEVWIDETERRTWFLFEASRRGDATGH